MKRIILLLLIAIGLTTGETFAQGEHVQSPVVTWYKKANGTYTNPISISAKGSWTDTTVNAYTSYAYFLVQYRSDVTIIDSITRISGTPAGTVVLQGSNDSSFTNATMFNMSGDTTTYSSVGKTYTITNTSTQVPMWFVPKFPFLYGRLVTITTGTQSCVPKYKISGKR